LTWRGCRSWLANGAALVAAGCFCALAQGPLWIHGTALASVNLAVSLIFVCTGLLLRREPGQAGVAWALMLASYSAAWTAFSGPMHCCDTLILGC
jgi:hypothetical protein